MRTITKTFHVHTIDELKGDALKQALEHVSNRRHQDFVDFAANEFIKSVHVFAKRFGFRLTEYSVGFFDPDTHIHLENVSYFDYSNDERNRLVKELNDSIISETNGACSLTGVYTDALIFDYFKDKGGTTYNDLHKDVVLACKDALKRFVSTTQDDILDENASIQFAKDFEMEFLPTGAIYYED